MFYCVVLCIVCCKMCTALLPPGVNPIAINKIYSWFQTFAVYWMLYAFFWVIRRRLNFICRRFETLCLFHLHRQIGVEILHLSANEEWTECSEKSAYEIQTPANYPEESIKQNMSYIMQYTCVCPINKHPCTNVPAIHVNLPLRATIL